MSNISVGRQKLQICNRLATAEHGGQKNRNGNDYGSYCIFCTSICSL